MPDPWEIRYFRNSSLEKRFQTWIQGQAVCKIFFGLRLLPLQQTGYSTIGIDSRAAGIELESTAEIGNGSFQISFHLPRYATLVIGHRIVRVDLDRQVKVNDSSTKVMLKEPSPTSVVEGSRIPWLKPERFVVVRQSPLPVFLQLPGIAAVRCRHRRDAG